MFTVLAPSDDWALWDQGSITADVLILLILHTHDYLLALNFVLGPPGSIKTVHKLIVTPDYHNTRKNQFIRQVAAKYPSKRRVQKMGIWLVSGPNLHLTTIVTLSCVPISKYPNFPCPFVYTNAPTQWIVWIVYGFGGWIIMTFRWVNCNKGKGSVISQTIYDIQDLYLYKLASFSF